MPKNKGHDLDDRIILWVIRHVDKRAVVQSIEKLKGSTSSTLYRISLKVDESMRHVVVRQFDNEDWFQEEPDLARHEAESLHLAREATVKTPEIIAYDEASHTCGVPLVLMSLLEGAVDLKPDSKSNWIDELAKTLVDIHKVEAGHFQWEYFTYQDIQSLEVPSWSRVPAAWEKALQVVKGPRPAYQEKFIHRDFHPANVLWKDGEVSGVVDWPNACRGPAEIDLGHCRVNLAMLYDVATADAFLTAYQHTAGANFTYHVYWDLVSLVDILFGPPTVYSGWTAFGVTGLTDPMMERRLDAYAQRLVTHL